ncbi:MAG: aspartyl-tRNA amidotransferase subunit B [Actinomycetota bacterium]|nr:MAG: aspartyl-tRNA amidotransferase subunit B [Actinomycetota bacterium]
MGQGLESEIHEAMTAALRAGDRVRLSALRMLLAAITNRSKELRRPLTDEEVREVAAKEVKKRGESIEAFERAGRAELAARERAEREVLAAFAPAPLGEEEVDRLIERAIGETGASSAGDLGRVMAAVMAQARGRVDGATVQRKVRDRLGAP